MNFDGIFGVNAEVAGASFNANTAPPGTGSEFIKDVCAVVPADARREVGSAFRVVAKYNPTYRRSLFKGDSSSNGAASKSCGRESEAERRPSFLRFFVTSYVQLEPPDPGEGSEY